MRSSLIIKNRDLLFLILRLQISRSDKDGLISTPYLRTEGVRCRNGPCPRWQPGRVAVPQDDGVCVSTTGSGGPDPKPPQGTAMDYYAGIDVSLEQSSVCVVDANGKIVREAKVASAPEVLAAFFR